MPPATPPKEEQSMTTTPASPHVKDDRWARLAAELDTNATVAGPPIGPDEKSKLDVIDAELLLPEVEDEAIVIMRVKTLAGRVLEFDMELAYEAILDATDEYDEVDGEFVEHEFDLRQPEEVARYFGRRSPKRAGL